MPRLPPDVTVDLYVYKFYSPFTALYRIVLSMIWSTSGHDNVFLERLWAHTSRLTFNLSTAISLSMIGRRVIKSSGVRRASAQTFCFMLEAAMECSRSRIFCFTQRYAIRKWSTSQASLVSVRWFCYRKPSDKIVVRNKWCCGHRYPFKFPRFCR